MDIGKIHNNRMNNDECGEVLGMSDPTMPNIHVSKSKATVVVPAPLFGKSGDLLMDDKISIDVSLATAKRLVGNSVRVIVAICDGSASDA